VDNVLAATAHAGSARFTYSQITASSNVYLAQQVHGSGQIDFRSGDVHTTEVDHSVQFSGDGPGSSAHPTADTSRTEEIGVGKVDYLALSGNIGQKEWIKTGLHRNPHATVATTLADNAGVALGTLAGDERVVAVSDRGSATVEGTPTTRYLVTTAPFCAARKSAHTVDAVQQHPTTLWVDAKGRLVQARSSEGIDSDPPKSFFPQDPALATRMRGHVTSTATLDFSAFGQPVHISAPPAADVHSPASSSFGSITLRCAPKVGSSKR
jgi:hypothetical protein